MSSVLLFCVRGPPCEACGHLDLAVHLRRWVGHRLVTKRSGEARKYWVENRVLDDAVLNCFTAQRARIESTGQQTSIAPVPPLHSIGKAAGSAGRVPVRLYLFSLSTLIG